MFYILHKVSQPSPLDEEAVEAERLRLLREAELAAVLKADRDAAATAAKNAEIANREREREAVEAQRQLDLKALHDKTEEAAEKAAAAELELMAKMAKMTEDMAKMADDVLFFCTRELETGGPAKDGG